MSIFVERTCTQLRESDAVQALQGDAKSIEAYRGAEAYVLLGGPGLGKTTAFRREADATDGAYVTARDFLTFNDKPEWHDTTLFIDGLDEARAGQADGRTPLDAIRSKLYGLGCPRFRLSCREADWFGANDRAALAGISRPSELQVLRLDPLSDQSIRDLLQTRPDIQAPDGFIEAARERGIEGLLRSPQTLGMLADSVAANDWPSSRAATVEKACRKLLREHNQEHRIASETAADTSVLMRFAGRLCALQLLAGKAGYALPFSMTDTKDYLGPGDLDGAEEPLLGQVLGDEVIPCRIRRPCCSGSSAIGRVPCGSIPCRLYSRWRASAWSSAFLDDWPRWTVGIRAAGTCRLACGALHAQSSRDH